MADALLLGAATDNMNAGMAERWLKRSLTPAVSRAGVRSTEGTNSCKLLASA